MEANRFFVALPARGAMAEWLELLPAEQEGPVQSHSLSVSDGRGKTDIKLFRCQRTHI